MWRRIKTWLAKHGIIVMTHKEYLEDRHELSKDLYKIYEHTARAVINPVIHDLEKLRANTWDQDKITKMQEWLRREWDDSEN